MIDPKYWISEKSIFMEGQCFLRSRVGPAAFPSDVALRGQCRLVDVFSAAASYCDKGEMTPVKRCEGVNAFACPFAPTPT